MQNKNIVNKIILFIFYNHLNTTSVLIKSKEQ